MSLSSLVLWPLRFTASSYVLRVTCNAVTEDLTFSVTAGRDYWMSGDAAADTAAGNGDALDRLRACLETHSELSGVTLQIEDDMRVFAKAAQSYQILWGHANTTLDPLVFGWTATDTAGSANQYSPNVPRGLWRPGVMAARDTRSRARYVGGTAVALSGAQRTSRIAESAAERDLELRLIPRQRALQEYATSSEPYNTWEYAWQEAVSLGRRLRFYDRATQRGVNDYTLYRERDATQDRLQPDSGDRLTWWSLQLQLREVA